MRSQIRDHQPASRRPLDRGHGARAPTLLPMPTSPGIRGLVPNLRLPALPSGRRIHLALEHGIIGGAVWPSAVALSEYLQTKSKWLLQTNPLTVELGAGTGAVGLYAAALGARVVLTDVGPLTATGYGGTTRLLRLLKENADANSELFREGGGAAHVAELDWGQQKAHAEAIKRAHAPDGFELLLASDVIYQASGHAVTPLASVMARLLRKDDGFGLIAYTPRYADGVSSGVCDTQLATFQRAAQGAGLAMEEVHQTSVADPSCEEGTTQHPVVVMRVRRSL
jgi:predicted nicotinamide N-methyase